MPSEPTLVAPPVWVKAPDLLTGHREQEWTFRLMDKRDAVVGDVDGVTACDLTFNVNAEVRGGGSLEYVGPPIDWRTHRIQPWFTVKSAGLERSWPLGVFLPKAPVRDYGDATQPVTLELYDKLYLLTTQMTTSKVYTVAAGQNVTARVKTLLTNAGLRAAVTDSSATLRTAMAWPAGTSYLKIVNELLESINYFAMWVDATGTFRADPYVRPQDRAPRYSFIDDGSSIYTPDFRHERDDYFVPNRVILTSTVEGETPPMVAIATDNGGLDSPYSLETTGIRVVHPEDGIEAASQAVLDALAAKRLAELQRVTSTYEIEHMTIPLDLNDVVTFRRDAHSIDALTTVQTMSLSMGNGLTKTKLREVGT